MTPAAPAPTRRTVTPEEERKLRNALLYLIATGVPHPGTDAPDCRFPRVILDAATGYRWWQTIESPAYRHLPLRVVARAVAIAREIREGGDPVYRQYIEYSDRLRAAQTAIKLTLRVPRIK